jgi:hypothetical protein
MSLGGFYRTGGKEAHEEGHQAHAHVIAFVHWGESPLFLGDARCLTPSPLRGGLGWGVDVNKGFDIPPSP